MPMAWWKCCGRTVGDSAHVGFNAEGMPQVFADHSAPACPECSQLMTFDKFTYPSATFHPTWLVGKESA